MKRFSFLIFVLMISILYWKGLSGQDVQPAPDDPEVQREKHALFFAARKNCAMEFLVPYGKSIALLTVLSICFGSVVALEDRAKDNGDIYIVNYDSFDGDMDDISTTTQAPRDPNFIDFDEISRICNESFITSLSNTLLFNTTGKLLDENDKTSMCYFRCFFEKSGFMENFKLNVEMVRKYLWPATGDSIDHCESERKDELNACVRAFAITQCLMLRALTDARNMPTV
ncbi:general odorant-binding protein 84a [Drosophila innubila]|uniref:general odorant-binding protein 84a n=1 Tax=Drosophila innubila TaxID=198719 RepID=UPI00148CAB51|nr:general odorant-binding protein 84a [Drosophila innubila]